LEALKPWKKEVDATALKKIGSTRVLLQHNCRYKECNMGNLITDAMVDAVRKTLFATFYIYKIFYSFNQNIKIIKLEIALILGC